MVEKKTDKELELLKSVFKDNDKLLKLVRALFLGFVISKEDIELIKKNVSSNLELIKIIKKKIYPQLADDTEIGILNDFWLTLEEQVRGKSREEINQVVSSKVKVLGMFEKAISLLENPDGGKMNLDYQPDLVNDQYQVSLLARILYIKSINIALSYINIMANAKEETTEEVKARIKKDSSK